VDRSITRQDKKGTEKKIVSLLKTKRRGRGRKAKQCWNSRVEDHRGHEFPQKKEE